MNEELLKELRDATMGIKSHLEKTDAELKEFREGNEGLKSLLDSHKVEFKSLKDQYTGLLDQISKLETRANRPPMGGAKAQDRLAKRFSANVATHKEERSIVEFKNAQEAKSIPPMDLNFGQDLHEMRSILSHTQSPIGDNMRVPGVSFAPFRRLRLRDLVTVAQTTQSGVEFVRQTRFNQLAAKLTTVANAAQKDLVVNNINGFFVGQILTMSPGHANEETGTIASMTTPTEDSAAGTITLVANLANAHAAWSPASSYDLGLVVSDEFVATPEAHLKPNAEQKYEVANESVKTLAHWVPAALQMLDDESYIQAHVEMQLILGLALTEERQMLYGDGTSNQFQGIMTHADVGSYAWSSGTIGDTEYDAIRRAATFVEIANFAPDAVVVHPTKWEAIQTAKGSDGHYLNVMLLGPGGEPIAWGMPLVSTTAIDAADGLIGAFQVGATLWDRMTATIKTSDSHEDYFVRNMVVILAELREAFTVQLPESFYAIDFDNAPV